MIFYLQNFMHMSAKMLLSYDIMISYLRNRYQRTKVNGEYSSWEELLTGFTQGLVLGPLLFDIHIND